MEQNHNYNFEGSGCCTVVYYSAHRPDIVHSNPTGRWALVLSFLLSIVSLIKLTLSDNLFEYANLAELSVVKRA